MARSGLKYVAAVVLTAALVASGACSGKDTPSSSEAKNGQYPRNKTLYTSGTMWGPPKNWNPIVPGNQVMGVVGLVYEPLFIYDPQKLKLSPWLAEKGEWASDLKSYTISLHKEAKWADGKPVTADDVKYTLDIGKVKAVQYSTIWDWIQSVDVVDKSTVKVSFKDSRVQEWENWLYMYPVLPKHVWSSRSDTDLTTVANEKPMGSGPYAEGTHSTDRMVWKKRKDWWGEKALGLKMQPTYIVDIVNSSNEVALGLLLQGKEDLNNNFLPGIANLVKGNFSIKTYYDKPPYMLSYNTATLIPNTTKAPMNDVNFRRALAWSVDTKKIVESVYGNIVAASDPTGLLPMWDKYIDKSVVNQFGFKFDTNKAKSILAAAGYKDTDGDKFVESPKGEKIQLKLIVPSGWTDWMEAARVMTAGYQAAGMNVRPEFPDSAAVDDARTSGNFDLLVNNWSGMSNTPWTWWAYVFQMPIQKQQFSRNFERYSNPAAWELVQKLSRTPADSPDYTKTQSDIEKLFLDQLPVIPYWYNGLWAQMSNTVWTNWPSDAAGAPKDLPCVWNNVLQMGGIKVLADIKPAKK